jgi:hypothetical protein
LETATARAGEQHHYPSSVTFLSSSTMPGAGLFAFDFLKAYCRHQLVRAWHCRQRRLSTGAYEKELMERHDMTSVPTSTEISAETPANPEAPPEPSTSTKKGTVRFIDCTEEMEGGGFQIIGAPPSQK